MSLSAGSVQADRGCNCQGKFHWTESQMLHSLLRSDAIQIHHVVVVLGTLSKFVHDWPSFNEDD